MRSEYDQIQITLTADGWKGRLVGEEKAKADKEVAMNAQEERKMWRKHVDEDGKRYMTCNEWHLGMPPGTKFIDTEEGLKVVDKIIKRHKKAFDDLAKL